MDIKITRLVFIESTNWLLPNNRDKETITWSMAHGIKQRRLSLPENRCGNELGNDGTAWKKLIMELWCFKYI